MKSIDIDFSCCESDSVAVERSSCLVKKEVARAIKVSPDDEEYRELINEHSHDRNNIFPSSSVMIRHLLEFLDA